MKQLCILGAGGHGKVIADIAKKNGYEKIVFTDNNPALKECSGHPIIGNCESALDFCGDTIVAIGDAAVRRKFQEMLLANGNHIPTLIHPNAVIADEVTIGTGTVIMAGVVISPGTVIGNGCIINTCASIDHDCVINDFVHISVGAHLAGAIAVGENSWVGIGTVISNNITLCENCWLGAGTVVVRDITESGTYFGVPAKKHSDQF